MDKRAEVTLAKTAQKDLKKIPRHILIQFDEWVETIENDGYRSTCSIKGYNDHPLKGDRKGQRSAYLSRSYRVIYQLIDEVTLLIVEVLEVNKHEYKK